MKTRITDLFGIQYPIIQGAMQWLSKPKLAAAVSNAGGLGTINMTTYDTPEAFQQDIQLLKTLTDKPFCVNLSLLPDTKPDGPIKGFLQAITEEKVRIVETAGSSPKPFMDTLKGAGCLVMHKIPDSRFAHTAQEVGCDAVCIVGYEGGGHPGMAGVGSLVQWPLTTERCTLPVVGAGGVCDGRTLYAALPVWTGSWSAPGSSWPRRRTSGPGCAKRSSTPGRPTPSSPKPASATPCAP